MDRAVDTSSFTTERWVTTIGTAVLFSGSVTSWLVELGSVAELVELDGRRKGHIIRKSKWKAFERECCGK